MNLLILKSWIFIINNFENTEKTLLDYIYSKRNNFGICLVVTSNLEPLLKKNLYQQPRNQSTNSVTVFGCLIFSDFLISYTFHWLSLVRRYVYLDHSGERWLWKMWMQRESAGVWWHWTSWAYGNAGANSVTNCKMTGSSRTGCSSHARTSAAADLMQQVLQEGWTSVERGDDVGILLRLLPQQRRRSRGRFRLSTCVQYFSIIVFKSMLSFSN